MPHPKRLLTLALLFLTTALLAGHKAAWGAQTGSALRAPTSAHDGIRGGTDADPDEFSTNKPATLNPSGNSTGDSFYSRFTLENVLEWIHGFFKKRLPNGAWG